MIDPLVTILFLGIIRGSVTSTKLAVPVINPVLLIIKCRPANSGADA